MSDPWNAQTIAALLCAHGLDAAIEDTGGGMDVAVLPCARGVVAVIDDGRYYVSTFEGDTWDESGEPTEQVSTEHGDESGLVDLVRMSADFLGGAR